MNEFDWSRCYQVLQLDPRADWNALRAAYRSQIRRWHPDRIGDRPNAKRLADEQSKAINNAYKQLTTYYRTHGCLPGATSATQSTPVAADDSAGVASNEETSVPISIWTSAESHTSPYPSGRSRHFSIGAVSISTIAVALIVYLSHDSNQPSGSRQSVVESAPNITARGEISAPPSNHLASPVSTIAKPTFAVGSTIGEVYSAQGTPSRTENDIWHYGASRVHFVDGRVTQWEEAPENPLNTRLGTTPQTTHLGYIAVGATKSEVRAIQGDPVRETSTTWEYGVSRIYFKNDLVSGWEESPLYPLKLRR